jgi:halocyanin-like protein
MTLRDDSGATRHANRRRVLLAGAAAVGGLAAVAGCTGGGGDDDRDPQQQVDDYLSNDDTYDGNIEDRTDESSPTVAVGAEGNGNNFAYAPSAIRVATGTTVTWEWTGLGSRHNVVHENGAFDSRLVAEEGHTYQYTFESEGVFRYYCSPHETAGMKGAVVVEG